MERQLKPVSFNNSKEDMEILDYVQSIGIGFSPYVKLLIRYDMMGRIDKEEYEENKVEEQGEVVNTMYSMEKKIDLIIAMLRKMENDQIVKNIEKALATND